MPGFERTHFMRTLLVSAASALFFAALVTELSNRIWPGNYIALLALCAFALFFSGLLNIRLARGTAAAGAAGAATPLPRQAQPRESAPRRASGDRAESGRSQAARAPAARPAPTPRASAPEVAGPREQGTVKWFNRTKGFGFVIRESGDEIFVHQRSIRATGEGDERRRPMLQDGQTVSFVVVVRDKGPQAEDVVPAEND